METRRCILHVAIQARTIPADGLPGAPRTYPLPWPVRGTLILALVLGGLGAGAAAPSYYGGGHASAHQPTGNVRLAAAYERLAWMY
jgi:hypothetical protein